MAIETPEETEEKSGSMMALIISFLIVSGMAVGTGWFLSTNMQGPSKPEVAEKEIPKDKSDKKGKKKGEENSEVVKKTGNIAVRLEPIIVGLSGEQGDWLRIELAVVAPVESNLEDPIEKVRVEGDITAFLKTLTLKQISGPSGYLHLKEDLLDRARLSTEGKIDELMILTLVTE